MLLIAGVSVPATSQKALQPMHHESVSDLLTRIDLDFPQIRAILIHQDDQLLVEKYFHEDHQDTLYPLYSMTKSVVSMLVGIALQEGYLEDLQQPVSGFFPEYLTEKSDAQLDQVTLEHALTMTSGFDLTGIGDSRNFIQLAMELPLRDVPGTHFNYNDLDPHLLSGVLSKTTGMNALDFANAHLFGPLGIEHAEWTADPQGVSIGCSELSLTARDMLKLWMLLLHNGEWQGGTILSSEWITASVRPQNPGGSPFFTAYGYGWWVSEQIGAPGYFAGGYGGQYIFVIPDRRTVVVVTSNTDRHYAENFTLIGQDILPMLAE